jgi:hypothetical protein
MSACSIGKLAVQKVQKVQQGFDPAPATCIRRLPRLDEVGLIWLLRGRPVICPEVKCLAADCLDGRDLLIVKANRQEPLVVLRMSLATEIAKGTA